MTVSEDAQPTHDKEWERKQRAREYRVAARREKRNRKADEKKQRKLNATILRRMTRNPDKYNKNAERNRVRAIELERRKIYQLAIQQAQQLAAIHDPSGALFNVDPVVRLEDGTVITRESLKRREERKAEKAYAEHAKGDHLQAMAASSEVSHHSDPNLVLDDNPSMNGDMGEHPEHISQAEGLNWQSQSTKKVSKKYQKKLALYEPRPPPPKPIIPNDIPIPEGEENWLALWNLSEEQLERRVTREKRRRAAERKALRIKQKSGKAERRAARDEKRKVYRDFKLEWKTIKDELTKRRTKLRSLEDEESKKIAVKINTAERKAALDLCQSLGFTIENTPGTDEVKPKALGMKGVDVDFDAIEKSDKQGDIRLKQATTKPTSRRVDLAKAAESIKVEYISTIPDKAEDEGNEFIEFDIGEGQDYQALTYNHKVRRKLRRALDNADIKKEMLVRDRAIEHLKEKGEEVPLILLTQMKPLNVKGHRILENGRVETAKQERVRARMELTEFNSNMKVLRRQAKEAAIYAGLKMHAELTGRVPRTPDHAEMDASSEIKPSSYGDTSANISIGAQFDDTELKTILYENSSNDEVNTEQNSKNHASMSETSSDSLSYSSRG